MNFKKIFGWKLKKANSEETTKQALQKLCETENILFKKQEYLEKKVTFNILYWNSFYFLDWRRAFVSQEAQYFKQTARVASTQAEEAVWEAVGTAWRFFEYYPASEAHTWKCFNECRGVANIGLHGKDDQKRIQRGEGWECKLIFVIEIFLLVC